MAQELPLNTLVSTPDAKIEVIGPNAKPLPPGRYVFQLTVIDSLEIESAADDGSTFRAHVDIADVETIAADPDVIFVGPRQDAIPSPAYRCVATTSC